MERIRPQRSCFRAGAWDVKERRFLTRQELGRLLHEIAASWRPLFELLAATGLRSSEAIALRWSDLVLDERSSRLRVSRAIVRGVANAPKSRHGARRVPLPCDLAANLLALRPPNAADDALVFLARDGAPADVGSLRRRVLVRRPSARGFGCRLPHAAPHVRLAADRVGHECAAPAGLDGPRFARLHAGDHRPPHRRRSRPGT